MIHIKKKDGAYDWYEEKKEMGLGLVLREENET
jgi:hypothetical protein